MKLLRARALPWLVCLLAGPWTQAAGPVEEWSGLLALRPQLPGRIPFLVPKFTGGSLPVPGEHRFRADILHTNTLQFTRGVIASERPAPELEDVLRYIDEVFFFTRKELYYFDGETTRVDLGWTGGMPGGWELGLELPVIRHAGGSLDSTINNFHGNLGLSDAGRDSAPSSAAAAVLRTPDGGYELTGGDLPGGEPGDFLLSARFGLPVRREGLSMDLAALVEAPTGDPDSLAGSGSFDFGAAYALHWSLTRWRFTFGLGYSWLGDLDRIPDVSIADTWTATGGFEFRATPRISVLWQVQHSTSPYADLRLDGLSDPAGNSALGGRFALGEHWRVDVGLVEDLLRNNSDVDVGVLLSVGWVE